MGRNTHTDSIGQEIQYDPNFDGPTKRRSCTDVICTLFFLVFIGCWVALGIWAIKNGDPQVLLTPRDSLGQRCGVDANVKNREYLFFFDITKCISPTTPFTGCNTPQVCVETCPTITFFNEQANQNKTTVIPWCQADTIEYSTDACPTWVVPSTSFQYRCVPDVTAINNYATEIAAASKYTGGSIVTDLEQAISNVKLLSNAEKVAQQVIEDVATSWWKILIGVGLAAFFCLIYIMMLRWLAGIIIWFSIAAVIVALGAAVYFSAVYYVKYKNEYIDSNYLNTSSKTNRDILLAVLIIAATVLAIILFILLFLRKRITLAIALVKEGSKAVSSVTSVLLFPIFPWILQIGVIAYAICVAIYLTTVGEPFYVIRNFNPGTCDLKNYTYCDPKNFTEEITNKPGCSEAVCRFHSISNKDYYPYFQAFNVFQFFWTAFFVSALGQMVLAQVFAKWYWTMRKRNLPFFAVTLAFWTTIRYHIGTIAFGSLIIAICRMIRVCLEYIDQKLKKYDNEVTKAIMCCLKCFFWCLEKFLKFINKNAYIMCAIHGKNFCSSAKDAFSLLVRNIIRVFVLDKITDFLFFLSKLVVTIGVAAIAYVFFALNIVSFVDNSNLNYPVVPVIIIAIVTYFIATLFFNVYSMAVDTLFLCFLEDIERNDGKSRPYFMSRNLMKIFGKRNANKKND